MSTKVLNAKFDPGRLAITPNCAKKINPEYGIGALQRHLNCDWGMVDDEDWQANNAALRNGGRVLSSYPLPDEGHNFWLITEGAGRDRVTTFLLPSDY
jgi:hypothetical protein